MKREFDREWIAAVDESYRPEPMNARQRAEFDVALAERLGERERVRRHWIGVAAGATAALVLWLGTARVDRPAPQDSLAADSLAADDPATPVVYAFVAPESYGEALLPDDYAALASVLEIDGDENR
jgi:hypothetical protein